MPHCIARILSALLQFLLPPAGRHRASEESHAVAPTMTCDAIHVQGETPLRGEDSPLVRPYLTTHEQQEEERLQRQRRRHLWLATHGIDAGPHLIHGQEVPA